jgi:hypothetical protein
MFVSGRTAVLLNIQRVECPHAVRSVDSQLKATGIDMIVAHRLLKR